MDRRTNWVGLYTLSMCALRDSCVSIVRAHAIVFDSDSNMSVDIITWQPDWAMSIRCED